MATPCKRDTSLRHGLLRAVVALSGFALFSACLPPDRGIVPRSPGDLPLRRAGGNGIDKIEPALQALLDGAPPSARIAALVDLAVGLDLDRYHEELRARRLSKRDRREAVISALESVAEREQGAIGAELDALIADDSIYYVRAVAIVNRIIVEGTPEGIRRVASLPRVSRVLADWTSERFGTREEPTPTPEGQALPDRFSSWAIPAVGADRLWASGLTGRGVLVASIDTGAYGEHEQLAGRNATGGRGWFDPVEGSEAPRDPHGHGTSVLSVAVGGNPDGRIVGVAPGATWACAAGNHHNFYSRIRMTLAADWVLRTARPDVLVNAWSHDEDPCTDFDLAFIRAWQAAEIFVVFPAGNSGPEPESGESPASLPGAFPDGRAVFSVAGLARSGEAHVTSSRGPSRCGSPAFPSLAAPGAEIPAAVPPDPRGYASGHGTSLSAGLIGGAAALLLEAVPEASPREIEQALLETARDVPPEGRDAATGAGIVDLPAALDRLRRRDVP